MFKDYCNMKKNYNCPDVEVIAISAMTALCESQFGTFTNGGGAGSGTGAGANVDPINDGL